jgi:hypothetical protein
MRNIFVKPALVAGLLAVLAPPAVAGTVTLESLLEGGSIQVGTKTFTNFGDFAVASHGGCGVDPNKVYVTGVSIGSQVGLTFYSAQFSVTSPQALGIHFVYDVVSGPGSTLHSTALAFQAAGHNTGNAKITASMNDGSGLLTVSTASGTYKTTAALAQPSATVHTSLDISLFGGVRPTGVATIDHFTLLYDNPEPGSLTLLGIGVVGLLGYRWRRGKRSGLA